MAKITNHDSPANEALGSIAKLFELTNRCHGPGGVCGKPKTGQGVDSGGAGNAINGKTRVSLEVRNRVLGLGSEDPVYPASIKAQASKK